MDVFNKIKNNGGAWIVAATVALSGCASNLSYQDAMEKNRRNAENTKEVEDATFMVEAKSLNLAQTMIHELATERGYSADLVNFAKAQLDGHEELKKDLGKVARKEKIKLPGELKAEHQSLVDELRAAGRSDFDSEYIQALKELYDDNLDLYSKNASEAADADVRAFAARKLGFYQAVGKEIARVDDKLMHTHR